eukprot:6515475-Pyramimonas_sp.AAC.1
MYTGLPEFDGPRYSGRAAGCLLEKVPLSCAWETSARRKASALTQKWITLRRVTLQWLRAQDSTAPDRDAASSSAVARMEEVGSVWRDSGEEEAESTQEAVSPSSHAAFLARLGAPDSRVELCVLLQRRAQQQTSKDASAARQSWK